MKPIYEFIVLDQTVRKGVKRYLGFNRSFELIADVQKENPVYGVVFGVNYDGPYVQLTKCHEDFFIYMVSMECGQRLVDIRPLEVNRIEQIPLVSSNGRWIRTKIGVMGLAPFLEANLCLPITSEKAKVFYVPW